MLTKMRKVFRLIKRKKNRRQIQAVVLLLLFSIELFSHVYEIGHHSKNEILHTTTEINAVVIDEANEVETASLVEAPGHGSGQPTCQDEVSHHYALISGFHCSFNTISNRGDQITYRNGDPLFNSLRPLFQPPKRS